MRQILIFGLVFLVIVHAQITSVVNTTNDSTEMNNNDTTGNSTGGGNQTTGNETSGNQTAGENEEILSSHLAFWINVTDIALLLVDYQTSLTPAVGSIEQADLLNNVQGLIALATAFEVPVIVTTYNSSGIFGSLNPDVASLISTSNSKGIQIIDRPEVDPLHNQQVLSALTDLRRGQLAIAGLLTDASVSFAAVSGLEQGYQVFIVEDASGAITNSAHQVSLQRLIQLQVAPTTFYSFGKQLEMSGAQSSGVQELESIYSQYIPSIQFNDTFSG